MLSFDSKDGEKQRMHQRVKLLVFDLPLIKKCHIQLHEINII